MQSIREIIQGEGLTEAAESLGYSRQYLWMVLTGRRPVSAEMLRRAHRVYGARLDLASSLSEPSTAAAPQ